MKSLVKMLIPMVAVLFVTTAGMAADLKVGHVNLQRLVSQSSAGKTASELYAAKVKKYQEDLDTRTEKLKKLGEDIEKESKALKQGEQPPRSLVDKNKEYGAQNRELQQLRNSYQSELKIYDDDMTRDVLEKLSPIMAEYAEKNGYDYILRNSDTLIFAKNSRDLTDEIINEFNKKSQK